MAKYCENCGCIMEGAFCSNCDEEVVISSQEGFDWDNVDPNGQFSQNYNKSVKNPEISSEVKK